MKKKVALGTLLVAYLVSAGAAIRNPLGIADHKVSLSLQSGTVVALALMLPLLPTEQRRTVAAVLTILGASLVLRLCSLFILSRFQKDNPNRRTWIVRWDTFSMMGGVLMTTYIAAAHMGGPPLGLLLLLLGIPLIVALPRLSNDIATYNDVIRASMDVAEKANTVQHTDQTPDAEYIQDRPTGTLAGVTSYGDTGVPFVFFGSSQSWTDWVRTNANIALTNSSFSPGKVHTGFLKSYMSVRDKLWVLLQDFMLRNGGARNIVICGHSLGGALATIAAADIAARLDPADAKKIICCTFGAPQVGDAEFVSHFNAIVPVSLRIAAVYDPITKVFSVQLPHVKGYIPVASPPIIPFTHDLAAYRLGIQQSPTATALVMAAPVLSLCLFTFLFSNLTPHLT